MPAKKSALTEQVGGDHYQGAGIQPVVFLHANQIDFIEGNVIKYVCRHREKGGAEDIRKALHYLRLLLELEYGATE